MTRKSIVRSLLSFVGAMGLVAALVAPAAAAPPPWSPPGAGGEPVANAIGICCTWGTGIIGGITYTITGTSDQAIIDEIAAGVDDWQSQISDSDVHFDYVPSGAAEVTIRYKRGGGTIAGSTSRSSSAGFISGASMSISGKAFGQDAFAQLRTVTSHEWGHVLGLDHANGSGLLMSPSLNSGSPTITTCDLHAAEYVLDWIIDGGSTPIAPTQTSFGC